MPRRFKTAQTPRDKISLQWANLQHLQMRFCSLEDMEVA